jgi:hypothetical protein
MRVFLKILPLLLVMGLYASVIRLPFFSDDIEFYTYLNTIQPAEIFTRADANGLYWRPIPNLAYYFLPTDAPVWHMIILWTHLLGVAFIGGIAQRLGLNKWGQALAMAIFGVFPFAVQAVTWVLSWGHVLSTVCTLGAIWCLLQALRTQRSSWFVSTLIISGIAPFTHENGILVLIVLGLFGGYWAWQHQQFSRLRWAMLWIVPVLGGLSAFYWLHRASMVTSRINFEGDIIERYVRFFAYFAQGLSLPFQVMLAPFATENTVMWVWLGVLSFLGACGAILWWNQRRQKHASQWLLVGILVLWWLIACAPTVIALPPHYNIRYDERLLYVTAPSVALFMGLVFSQLRPLVRVLVSSGVVLMMTLMAGAYLQMFSFLGGAWTAFFEQLPTISTEQRGLLINFPRFIESPRTLLPFSRPNAQMMQIEFSMRDIVWTNTRQEYPHWQGVAYLEELQAQPFPMAVDVWNHYIGWGEFGRDKLIQRLQESDLVWRYEIVNDEYVLRRVGERHTDNMPALTNFGNLALISVTYDGQEVALRWRKTGEISAPLIAYVHVLCGDTIITQSDALPLNAYHSFEMWQIGEDWTEYRTLPNDSDCRRLRVGVYQASDATSVLTANGEAWVIIETTGQ